MDKNQIGDKILGLTIEQTEILYNLQVLAVELDITDEKDTDMKNRKREWLDDFKYEINESFIRNQLSAGRSINWINEDELREIILKEAGKTANKRWFYLIVMEAVLFNAYFPLKIHKNEVVDKKGRKKVVVNNKETRDLKLCKDSKGLSAYIANMNIIEYDFIARVKKAYKREHLILSGNMDRLIFSGLIYAIAIAISAGSAALLAPKIAVLLFGTQFAGLHGAALTSAVLAYIGGGAIASGGGGMAAGIATIVGGGALFGAGTGSIAAGGYISLSILTDPNIILLQTVKLSISMKEILLKSQNDTKNAKELIRCLDEKILSVVSEYKELREKINSLKKEAEDKVLDKKVEVKHKIKDEKKESSNLKKAIRILNKTSKEMNRYYNKHIS